MQCWALIGPSVSTITRPGPRCPEFEVPSSHHRSIRQTGPRNPNSQIVSRLLLPPISDYSFPSPMGKKSKQPEDPSLPENAAVPSIFDKLFGDVPKGDDSIFADDNPFRRKKAEYLPQEQQVQANGDDAGAEDAKPVVKGKRMKDKNYGKVSADGASTGKALEAESKSKKSKKEEVNEGNGEMRNGGMEEEDGERKVEKKKKKRKWDELEKEYEKRVYGAVEEEKPVVGKKRKKVDDPASLMVAKEEGFDDESKLMRTVFVGNLPLKMKKKSLLKEFGQFGEIDSIRIRSVPIVDSKTPRKGAIMKKQINEAVDSVHAYVVFKIEESAQASLQHNMAVVGGNHIRVDRACPPRKKLKGESSTPIYDNKRTIFVGNLPFDVQDEELYRLFCGIKQLESSVEAVRVIRDPHNSLGKGIAYVLFKTREAAISVLKRQNLKLRERELRLSRAKADSTPEPKRKSPMSPSSDNSLAKKFARNSSGASSGSYSGVKTAAPLSYQGVRASKSGIQKKTSLKRPAAAIPQPKPKRSEKVKVHSTKRPAVAARKAKALNLLSASKQGAKKRKPGTDSTPSSSHKRKRVRKF